MEVYCPRCATSLPEVTSEALMSGACPTCTGQLLLARPRPTAVAGAVAITFDLGSHVGAPFEPGFLRSSLSGGTPRTEEEAESMSDGDSEGGEAGGQR
jgi:hypothetical protein